MNWMYDEESETAVMFEVKAIENHKVCGMKHFSDSDKELTSVDIDDVYDGEDEVYEAITFR